MSLRLLLAPVAGCLVPEGPGCLRCPRSHSLRFASGANRWKIGDASRFPAKPMSSKQFVAHYGALLVALGVVGTAVRAGDASTPTQPPSRFDWRSHGSVDYVTEVESYLVPPGCDAGWAFAVASMVGDRLSVQTGNKGPKTTLSAQVLLNCATPTGMSACNGGGRIEWALAQLNDTGLVDHTCMSYRGRQDPCDLLHVCVDCFPPQCRPVHDMLVYTIDGYGPVALDDIKNEIAARGPVACKFKPMPRLGRQAAHGFAGVVVGWRNESQFIVNTNWGARQTTSTNASAPISPTASDLGFYTIDNSSVLACWGVGTITATKRQPSSMLRKPSEEATKTPPTPPPPVPSPKPMPCGCARPKPPQDMVEVIRTPRPVRRPRSAFPPNFDWRTVNGSNALTPMRNHHTFPHYCGGCYAMASTSTFSDRLKIMRGPGAEDVLLSAQMVVDCVRTEHSHGCLGGNANDVFQYMQRKGMTDESCKPFISREEPCEFIGACTVCSPTPPFNCTAAPKSTYRRYYAKEHGLVSGELDMMSEIFERGPIECMMATPKVFEKYTGGIMCDDTNDTAISHDVEIVGWGRENGTEYWLARNSWGTAYGEEGFFRVCRGTNNMGIESACAWVVPDLERSGL